MILRIAFVMDSLSSANSLKHAAILFNLIASLFITSFPSVTSQIDSWACNNASAYADGSTFSSNLKRVMDDLLKNTPQTGFNTCSYGQIPNRIYGLLQCTGNISESNCSICSQQAIDSVLQICGNSVGSRVWLDNCFVRYENCSFFSKLDTDGKYLENKEDIDTGNIYKFRTATSNLISNLSNKAYVPGSNGFAEGSAPYSVNGSVYGLVQCWRDLSIRDCRSCLQIATEALYTCCSLKQGAQALLGNCRVRYEIYPVFGTSPAAFSGLKPATEPAQTTPATGTSQTKSGSPAKTLPIILGFVGGGVLALMVCLFVMRRKLNSAISWGTVIHYGQKEEIPETESTLLGQKQILFTLDALREATDNFDEKNMLGQGGFGHVFKGLTRDGKEIAVKKLCLRSGQGKQEFMNEVKLLAIQHRNLVKLLGCCVEGQERLLVYEYMPNKSLDTFLFEPEKKRHLNWKKRYNIIMGIARGLLYLHEDSHMRIIHRDIKANNILLDEELNPKIADFGLARLFPEDETHIQTRVAGTYGYMAPEYAMRGKLSVKADVYSFGVLVLEIVSGRKSSDLKFPDEAQSLLEWAWRLYKQGRLLDMIDSTVRETCRREEALRCIHVGLVCTQADPGIRPAISNAVLMISSSSVTLPDPIKPAFVKSSENSYRGSTAGSFNWGIYRSRSSAPASCVSSTSAQNSLPIPWNVSISSSK